MLASDVLRFNGKLFKQPDTLPLTREQIDLLAEELAIIRRSAGLSALSVCSFNEFVKHEAMRRVMKEALAADDARPPAPERRRGKD